MDTTKNNTRRKSLRRRGTRKRTATLRLRNDSKPGSINRINNRVRDITSNTKNNLNPYARTYEPSESKDNSKINLNPYARTYEPSESKDNSKINLNPYARTYEPSSVNNSEIKNMNTKNINTLLAKELNKINFSKINQKNVNDIAKSFHLPSINPYDYIAIDCEMVGIGPSKQSALAEVSLVDFDGKTIYHKYVKPKGTVTNYRTFVSGITPEILKEKGESEFKVKGELKMLLHNKILVGHGLQNDINAIGIDIPKERRWDTTEIPMFMRKPNWGGPLQAKKLKVLVKNFIGKNIQTGEHSATEDAEASMELFRWYLLSVATPEIMKAYV
jgi:DNA polymerase III epsilon subunit-like protein